MRLDLRHIRYFTAVAEELHFRRAAERLCIAQPALSRAIRNLEEDLEVTLFHRTNRSVKITQAGETFLKGCRGVINAIEHTVENTRLVHNGQIGSLRIGYTDIAIAGLLPSILKDFQSYQPGLVLQPHHDVTTTQLQKLDEGELDVGFVTGPINRQGYDQCLIQSEKFVCVLHENHHLAQRSGIRLEDLAYEDFIHGTSKDWEHFHAYLIPLCRRSGFVPHVVQEAFNTAGILGLVACGMGVTILTESVESAAGSGLVVVPLEDVTEQMDTLAIWKTETTDHATSQFIAFLENFNK